VPAEQAKQLTAPSADEYCPAEQEEQVGEPGDEEYWPAS
jgi:hypothetical protein